MTVGWRTFQKFQDVEQRCKNQGFKMARPGHNYSVDMIALQPADPDALPVYRRDVDLFIGTLDEVDRWLAGYEHAKLYLKMIKATSDQKIARCEQAIRNELLVSQLKEK